MVGNSPSFHYLTAAYGLPKKAWRFLLLSNVRKCFTGKSGSDRLFPIDKLPTEPNKLFTKECLKMTPCQLDFYAEVSADYDVAREHHYSALVRTLDDGRFIVITDSTDNLPRIDDWRAAIYDSEDDFHAAAHALAETCVAECIIAHRGDIDAALETLANSVNS